jgi:hypothetical protein
LWGYKLFFNGTLEKKWCCLSVFFLIVRETPSAPTKPPKNY